MENTFTYIYKETIFDLKTNKEQLGFVVAIKL
jgi:hypothetical protein